jgi:hypothetical protein
MQDRKTKFNKRMSIEDKDKILTMHQQGQTNVEIGETIGCSNTAVRMFLKKQGLNSNIKEVDRGRPCKICGKIFIPKCHDGVKKEKYTTCSLECTSAAISQSKIKYSQSDIDKVKLLKRKLLTNSEIVEVTNVDLNKVKEIVRENELYLSKEQFQNNAYQNKLAKNPQCMEDMREARLTCPTNVFNQKIAKIKEQLEKSDNKMSIPYLSKLEGLHDTSVRCGLHRRGLSNLVGTCSSGPEFEIIDFIKQYLPEIELEHGNRTILKPKEIDIYIPSLKLGIEYCGLYWHNENSPTPRDKNYHYNKMKACNEQGIRLITIFEDEWSTRRPQVENFLKSVLNIIEKRIYARKCMIKTIDKITTRDFLNNNHIQGVCPIKAAFGLFFENELVGVVTGNQHHRDSNQASLNRLAFKNGYQVIGGSGKLIKHLIKWAHDCGYQKLISWSDNRWSEGGVYTKCGFELDGDLEPDYSYLTPENQRESKQSNKKSLLLKKGALGSMSNTESELAQSLDYFKIWDCGKQRWLINLITSC